VKPAPFDYLAPDTLDEALAAMRQHGYDAKLLAGGQSLIPLLNFRLASPTVLVDLNRLGELDFVRPTETGGLSIGAMTRQSRLGTEPLIGERAPLLREAVPFIAHPQIRNRGTLGGTLAHADPAAELPVVALALDARLRLRSDSGERWVAARDFFVGLLTTALEPHEILVEIEIPAPPPRCGWSFHEIARRHGDYALAGLTAQVVLDRQGRCSAARLVYLSAGDGPVDATAAVEPLLGQLPDDTLLREVSQRAATDEVEPAGDIHASAEFKRHLCQVLTRRALATAFERAQDG
jgi:CO/xanthine dehydrogenase FAD-binding subunit